MPRRAARLRLRCRCLTRFVSSCFPLSAAQDPCADASEEEDATALRVRLTELEASNQNLRSQVKELQEQKQKAEVAIVYGVVDGDVASELQLPAESVGLRTPLPPARHTRHARHARHARHVRCHTTRAGAQPSLPTPYHVRRR